MAHASFFFSGSEETHRSVKMEPNSSCIDLDLVDDHLRLDNPTKSHTAPTPLLCLSQGAISAHRSVFNSVMNSSDGAVNVQLLKTVRRHLCFIWFWFVCFGFVCFWQSLQIQRNTNRLSISENSSGGLTQLLHSYVIHIHLLKAALGCHHSPLMFVINKLFLFFYRIHEREKRKKALPPQESVATPQSLFTISPSCQDSRYTCTCAQCAFQAIRARVQAMVSHVGPDSPGTEPNRCTTGPTQPSHKFK